LPHPLQGPTPKREVVFVIDNSGSMAGPSIEQARESLALAISKLKAEDKFNVVRFDDTMDRISHRSSRRHRTTAKMPSPSSAA
jgi:uncharacterized protein (DUF58 family)